MRWTGGAWTHDALGRLKQVGAVVADNFHFDEEAVDGLVASGRRLCPQLLSCRSSIGALCRGGVASITAFLPEVRQCSL